MNDNLVARINQVLAAGFVAGFFYGIVVALLTSLGAFGLLGVTITPPADVASWFVRQSVWGALWGLFFLVPVVKYRKNTARGLLAGVAPLMYLVLWQWPVVEQRGYANLLQSYPLLVAYGPLVLVCWGVIAGAWLDFSGFHVDSAREHDLDEGHAAELL